MNLVLAYLILSVIPQDMTFTGTEFEDFANLTEIYSHKEYLSSEELRDWLDRVENLKTRKEK